MKRLLYWAMAAVMFVGCGKDPGKTVTKAEGIDFDSVTVDTVVALLDEENSPQARLHLSMMYGTGENAESMNQAIIHAGLLAPDYMGSLSQKASMRQAVDTFVQRFISDYKKDYAPLYRGDRAHREAYDVRYHCHTAVQHHRNGVITYIAHTEMFGGGQHSVGSTIVKNIEVKTGKVIGFDDIFVAGYNHPLADLIVEQLCDDNHCKTLEELQEKGYFVGIEPYATDNFIWGEDGITFVYVDSEIASHETGEVRVTLSDEMLEHLLKK